MISGVWNVLVAPRSPMKSSMKNDVPAFFVSATCTTLGWPFSIVDQPSVHHIPELLSCRVNLDVYIDGEGESVARHFVSRLAVMNKVYSAWATCVEVGLHDKFALYPSHCVLQPYIQSNVSTSAHQSFSGVVHLVLG